MAVVYGTIWRHYHYSLQWRHNDHNSVSNHQPPGCLLNRLFRRRSKKTSKLRVTGLCVGNSPGTGTGTGTGEFPAQRASNAENVSIWWRHHVITPQWHKVCSVWVPLVRFANRWRDVCQIVSPADTWRNNNVIITSKRRWDVVLT